MVSERICGAAEERLPVVIKLVVLTRASLQSNQEEASIGDPTSGGIAKALN
jgi:hypothetical protein